MLAQASSQGALWNANLLGDFRLAKVQPFSQQEKRLHRQPLADQFRQGSSLIHRSAENDLSTQHIRYGLGRHSLPPVVVYAIWPILKCQIYNLLQSQLSLIS